MSGSPLNITLLSLVLTRPFGITVTTPNSHRPDSPRGAGGVHVRVWRVNEVLRSHPPSGSTGTRSARPDSLHPTPLFPGRRGKSSSALKGREVRNRNGTQFENLTSTHPTSPSSTPDLRSRSRNVVARPSRKILSVPSHPRESQSQWGGTGTLRSMSRSKFHLSS